MEARAEAVLRRRRADGISDWLGRHSWIAAFLALLGFSHLDGPHHRTAFGAAALRGAAWTTSLLQTVAVGLGRRLGEAAKLRFNSESSHADPVERVF